MSAAESRMRRWLALAPVIPVYTPATVDEAVQVAQALVRGGLPLIEVTLRTPVALDALRAMVRAEPAAVIGAGTVLDAGLLRQARDAGAAFAVSPGATPDLLRAAVAEGLPFLAGIATASDLMRGLEHGLDCFKFFPAAQAGGPALLQSFAGPFPAVAFCPTGGISAASAPDYLRLRNVRCVGGSWLTPADRLAAGDWAAVEALARAAAALPR
ncbi:bifunctional 4-hydroxy-2-oxoglutarate aldolase/2-dehydro-3-deoxy-phosphogluconate aldolase [Arenimonas sp. MALMAid1274]|uniref:bifunctional 4-hydroxy-2-oxoglutarate aldolase/2-dehydro-3-deoxy-phosphogluconate aldolase n=1 Tax=Arenimonas sp. MALMAid1274 TaxID=3411630 RepID=UPI003B9E346B